MWLSDLKNGVLLIGLTLMFTSGCMSTSTGQKTTPSNNETTQIAPPSKMIRYDEALLSATQLEWLAHINDFYQADMNTVVIPHDKLVKQLENIQPTEMCSTAHLDLVDQALSYNPTSLMALSYRYDCAQKNNNEALREEARVAISSISELLLRTGNGQSPSTAVNVRYINEIDIIFRWAGIIVFDIEMLRMFDSVAYKLHTFDAETQEYSIYYARNNQYFAKNAIQMGYVFQDKQKLADRLVQHYIDDKSEAALRWQYADWLRNDKPQNVIDALVENDKLLFSATILLAQAHFSSGDMRSVDRLIDDVLGYSEVGLLDASAFFGQVLLASDDPEEIAGAANLYRVNVEQHGAFNATMVWLDAFLRHPQGHTFFKLLLPNLSDDNLVDWRSAINRYNLTYGRITPVVYQKLTTMLSVLGETYVRAKLDYASLLLEGEWSNDVDEVRGLTIVRELAESGEATAQLDYGVLYSQGAYGLEQDRNKAFYWYSKAAKQGNQSALYNIGLAYRFARGAEKNLETSIDYFQQAYDVGFGLAGCRIGDIFSEESDILDYQKAMQAYQVVLDAEDVSKEAKASCMYGQAYIEFHQFKNIEKAITLFEQSGELGEENALFELGLIYGDGRGVDKDIEKATEYYLKAINGGSFRAAANLGFIYEVGDEVDIDLERAFRFYQISAKGGSGTGLNNLATFYRYGKHVEKDIPRALALYRESFAKGNRYAAENLGDLYYFGELGEPQHELACNYYEEAVKRGASDVMFDVGYCYVYGEGRTQDVKKGMRLLELSAKANDQEALIELGRLYASGEIVESDLQKSLNYFETAYALNNPRAAYALGLKYEKGTGVDKDPSRSLSYYKQSALWGMVEGMLATAKAYLQGFGAPKDKDAGVAWLKEAVKAGSEEAKALLDRM